ncbi:hypothetical protein CI102_5582, partial [Trichoderma harzianum]|uniref:Uncharacterized protein n=1 Tax=Trichoderma harzianum CBS 226.95 TaxID=983964 RepID=A0A2T4AS73_TRIHA
MAELGPFLPTLVDLYDAQFQTLCQTIWGWTPCSLCSIARPCVGEDCPHRRLLRLEPFFQFYKEVAGSYVPESLIPDDPRALSCHQDLIDIIRLLQEKPSLPRMQLTREFFSARKSVEKEQPPLADQHRAFNLAMRVLVMVGCRIEHQGGGLLEFGTDPCIWRSDQSPLDFTATVFPVREHPSLNDENQASPDIKTELSAVKLKQIAGLKFEGTAELREHLKLDQKTGVVEIYHFTSVLKEHLRASIDPIACLSSPEALISRRLALETLYSLQLLFPLDPDSQALLRSLVSKESFDPDCLRFGSASYRRIDENNIPFQYWGSRLMDLFDEIENPKPRGFVQTWLDQKSKARHIMLATLAGLFIAILLGFLGLIVAIVQTWISYQAWKHPVT